MKKYKHIFFDLDETIWDYHTNARDTLNEMFDHFQLNRFDNLSSDDFIDEFFRINLELWTKFDQRLIDKDVIRLERFPLVVERLGMNGFEGAMDLQDYFLLECPRKGKLLDNAGEVVPRLSASYKMHIITNGFEEIQNIKLESAGLLKYFDVMVTSESAGAQKPDIAIFKYALERIQAKPEECIMIGDNLIADIGGAKNAGMDQVYYNPQKRSHNEDVSHEINHLSELYKILL